MSKKCKIFFLLLVTVMLSGCMTSEKEAIDGAIVAVETAFNEESLDTNQDGAGFSYHVLSDFNIDSEDGNNIILEKGKKTFLLFVNPFESPLSMEVYETTVQKGDLLNHVFEQEDRVGFLTIRFLEDDHYELSTGIGGVKMTTNSHRKDIIENAKLMMQTVRSVQFDEQPVK